MKKDFKRFTQGTSGDRYYQFYPDYQGKKVLVLNNIFQKTSEINISKAFIELSGASSATNISVYWDKTGTHTNVSTLETDTDVVKLDYTTGIGNIARFDVTKALATLLSENDLQRNQRYFLVGNDIPTSGITCSITVYYNYKRGFRERNATVPFELKNASGNIDLSDSVMRMSYVVNNGYGRIPATVKLFYNSTLTTEIDKVYLDDDQFEQINYLTGKGWKTNYHQYVVCEKSSTILSDGESVGFFTWVNAQGNHIIFAEKYYAIISGNKKYLTPSQVTINQDGTMTYSQSGVTYPVTHDYVCRQLFKLKEISLSQTEKKIEILDLTDNKITFEQTTMATNPGVVIYRLSKIEDSYLNAVNISYNTRGWLYQISSVGGNTVEFEYDYDTDMLYSVKDMLTATTYVETVIITNGDFDIIEIRTPNNHRNISITNYPESNYIKTILDAMGNGYYFANNGGEIENVRSISKYKGLVDGVLVAIPSSETNKIITIDNVRYKYVDLYEIDYFDRYTKLTEMRNETSNNYFFDYFGNNISSYENNYDGEGSGNPQGKSFANSQQNLNVSTQNVFQSTDLTLGATYHNSYVEDINAVGSPQEKFAINNYISKISGLTTANKKVYYSSSYNDYISVGLTLSEQAISAIKNSSANNFIVSTWAMAKSLPIVSHAKGYKIDDSSEVLLYNSLEEQSAIDSSQDNYRAERLYQLFVEIKYTSSSDKDLFTASFDFNNPNFQQLQIPVRLRKNSKNTITAIKIGINYYNNNGIVYMYGTSMKVGSFSLEQYNNDKMPTFTRSTEHENYYTKYYYNGYNLPVDIHTYEENNLADEYTVEYEYNEHKALIKTTDSKNFVEENIYSSVGDLLQTKKYHVTTEGVMEFVEESTFDETSGNELTQKSPFGVTSLTKTYNHGAIATNTPAHSATISYDYDTALNLVETMTVQTQPPIETNNSYSHNETMTNSDDGTSFTYEYDGFGRVTKIKIDNEEYCTIEYTNENQKVVTYANGEKEKAVSDNDDKVLSVYCTDRNGQGGNNTAIEMNLSSYGTFKDLVDEMSGGTKYKAVYDDCGRPLKSVVKHERDNFYDVIIKRKYDANGVVTGQIIEHVNADIDEVDYTYESGYQGKLTDASHTAIGDEKQSYDVFDRTSSLYKASEDLRKDIIYVDDEELSRASNLIACEEYFANDTFENSVSYYYDALSRLTEVVESNIIVKKYRYDSVGRLAREDNRDFNKTFTFEYDTAGNILLRKEYAFTLDETLPTIPVAIISYGYDSMHKNRLISYNGETVGNYEIGNPWTYRGKSATWKNVHRLATFNGITFDYNYAGIRISKTANGVTTKFAINSSNIISEQKGSNVSTRITYFYGLDGITAFKYQGATYYYKKNFLGDIIGIYNSSKQIVAKYVYDAWGNCKVLNPNGTENTSPTFIGNVNPFRYRSYYFDAETGFYYLQSRYYDPQVGRFISMDAVENLDVTVVNALNLYIYCANNPTVLSDPDGDFWIKLVKTIVSAVVSAVVNVAIVTVKDLKDGKLGNDIDGKEYLAAGVSGFISGLGTGPITNMIFSGLGDVVGGMITGDVDSFKDASSTFIKSAVFSLGSDAISFGAKMGLGRLKYNKIIGKSSKNIDINKKLAKVGIKDLKIGRDGYTNVVENIADNTIWIKALESTVNKIPTIISGLFC